MSDKVRHIYIDGQRRGIVGGLDPETTGSGRCDWVEIYVDHPSLPGRKCERHLIPASFAVQARSGGIAVITGGHRYSFNEEVAHDT